MKKIILIGAGLLLVLILILGAVFINVRGGIPIISVDESNLPKFITANYINMDNIGYISQFRSNNGHDFSDSTSPCSSMKHYFDYPDDKMLRIDNRSNSNIPPAPTLENGEPIYSPVDGTIIAIGEEQFPLGKQIRIKVKSNPEFIIRLFHIYPLQSTTIGEEGKSGQQIGLINVGQGSDIAVEANVLTGRSFFSIFEVMSDEAFKQYVKHGVKDRNEFILSEEYRKEHPNKCEDEQFVGNPSGSRQEWVKL